MGAVCQGSGTPMTIGMRRNLLLACLSMLALTACESSVTVDFSTDAPTDEVLEARMGLAGVEFETEDGGTRTIDFNDTDFVDLLDYTSSRTYGLATKNDLSEGGYTGIRPIFDAEDGDTQATLTMADGGEVDLQLGSDVPFAAVDFDIKDSDSDDVALLVAMDLRLSLVDTDEDDDGNDWVLRPVMRAVLAEDASAISGSVSGSRVERCQNGNETLGDGVTVYLFGGNDVTPDDYDGTAPDPIATAPVVQGDAGWRYRIEVLQAGDYTVALTCDGNDEYPSDDDSDDIDFVADDNVTLDDTDEETVDFD